MKELTDNDFHAIPSTDIKIENDIPIPVQYHSSRKLLFPFEDMKPNDSFLLPENISRILLNNQIQTYKRKQKEPRPKFAIRKMEDGIRCWRLS